ncbi:MAG: hypothetical protein J6A97_05340 [Clostridia bacterium]|nr:hypothetical protein [Clostridia bacterium]
MENKGKINKSKLSAFRKSTFPRHFEAAKNSIVNDVQGSYTGTPVSFGNDDTDDLVPTQDADDL